MCCSLVVQGADNDKTIKTTQHYNVEVMFHDSNCENLPHITYNISKY